MLAPEEFLAQQFSLVDEAIKDALRHEYGPEESYRFFHECQERLGSIPQGLYQTGCEPPRARIYPAGAIQSRRSCKSNSAL